MWHLKASKENPEIPEYVYEGSVQQMEHLGRHSYNVEVFYGDKRFCVVKLWALGSCALSEFRSMVASFMPDDDSFMDWLKTQPFKKIDSWDHQIFVFLPGKYDMDGSPAFAKFVNKHCSVISSFPNHAHGGHTLNLYQLDLTKYVPATSPAVP